MTAEIDIEYDNGFRETIVIHFDDTFVMPFNGRIVGFRPGLGSTNA